MSQPSFASLGNGRDRIYPKVGPGLYGAIRGDTLEAWPAANPQFVTK